MKEYVEQDCALCGKPASYYFVSNGQRKYFDCAACGPYQITKSAERRLSTAPERIRLQFSERASETPEGMLFLIRVPPLHEHDPAQGKVTGKFVSLDLLDR